MKLRFLVPAVFVAATMLATKAEAQMIGAQGANCASGSFSIAFTECWYATGFPNDQPPPGPDLAAFLGINSSLAGPWSYTAKSDDNTPVIAPNLLTSTGTFTFSPALDGNFALTFKQGNDFLLYTFAQQAVPVASLTYNVSAYFNAISHANLLDGASVPCTNGDCNPAIVPEPASVALMFGGLFGLAVVSRRRREV